jgi:Ornithine decarboxylase antizyme
MKAVFLGEEGKAAHNGSIVMGTDAHSPPDESVGAYNNNYSANGKAGQAMDAWIEVWDYSSGCSFRVFVGGNGENKSLFAFFDSAVVGSDLKQGLVLPPHYSKHL